MVSMVCAPAGAAAAMTDNASAPATMRCCTGGYYTMTVGLGMRDSGCGTHEERRMRKMEEWGRRIEVVAIVAVAALLLIAYLVSLLRS